MEPTTTGGTETPTTGADDTEYTLTLADTDGEHNKSTDEKSLYGQTDTPGYRESSYMGEDDGEYDYDSIARRRALELLELDGEEMDGEYSEGKKTPAEVIEEMVEEEQFVEEPPPDPAAPFNFSDSTEAIKEPFQLRQDQIMEVEVLWELYQNYTPAYTDLDNYITEKELIYMLKALLLMTYTPEQLIELIEYCVRPPHPEGHINYDQFLKMVTIRQRDFAIEDELRAALHVYDPDSTGTVDREYLRDDLLKRGFKLAPKTVDLLIKEVDMSNDGTIGIDDMIGTMCIDLNREDIQMLKDTLNPPAIVPTDDDDI